MEIEYTTAHIADLERAIAELKAAKSEFTKRKMDFEARLTELKAQLKKYPRDRQAIQLVADIKAKLSEIGIEILKFNEKITAKAVLKSDVQQAIKDGKISLKALPNELREYNDKIDNDTELRLKLLKLKSKYLDFCSDHTRISSMRQMSADFVKEIEDILKNKR